MAVEANQTAERTAPTGLAGQTLYLFSSNVRPLYVQNILNFIAAPVGSHHTLRYERRWVDEPTQRQWSEKINGQRTLLHFSFQHRDRFFDPEFVPVRTACIHRAWTEGEEFFFVVVEITGEAAPIWLGCDKIAESVRAYRSLLTEHGVPHPYEVSAAFGPTIPDDAARKALDLRVEPTEALRRHAEVLSRVDAFSDTRFLRMLRLVDAASGEAVRLSPTEKPLFQLTGGRTYRLELFSCAPVPLTKPARFDATADEEVVGFVGPSGFEVASDYDLHELLLHSSRPTGGDTLETILAIRPADGTGGPRLDLPLAVREAWTDTTLTIGGSLAVLAPIALASIAHGLVKGILLGVGLAAAVVLQWKGRQIAGLIGPTQAAFKSANPPSPSGPSRTHQA
jgi:hypothetical protein